MAKAKEPTAPEVDITMADGRVLRVKDLRDRQATDAQKRETIELLAKALDFDLTTLALPPTVPTAPEVTPIKWRVGPQPDERNGEKGVWIEERLNARTREMRYAVTDGFACCWTKEGQWEYESLPSSRTDEFLDRARYHSFGDAVQAALQVRAPQQGSK